LSIYRHLELTHEDEEGMTNRITVIGSALSAMALTLAGCGSKPAASPTTNEAAASSNSPPARSAAGFDPCSLVTADKVTAIIADKITQTEVNDHSCEYHAGPTDEEGTQIMIFKTGGTAQMQDTRKANQLLAGIGGAVSLQGDVGKDVQASITPPPKRGAWTIGDETVWQPNGVLAVRKGELFVQVTPPIVRFGANGSIPTMISNKDKRAISQKLAEATLAELTR
jgi:hypothetical protein